jgi:hypothetical protein
MKKLGIDDRTPEQKFLDEIREESKEPMVDLMLNDGCNGGPKVNMIIDTRKNLAPKQDLSKPEKSIRIMQERGI